MNATPTHEFKIRVTVEKTLHVTAAQDREQTRDILLQAIRGGIPISKFEKWGVNEVIITPNAELELTDPADLDKSRTV